MHRARATRPAFCLILLGFSGGCGLSIRAPNPNRPSGTPPSCTTKKTAVTADWIGTGAGLGLGVISAQASSGVAAALLVGSGLFAVSAISGNRRVNECRDSYEAYFADRGIATPDSYSDYAVIADREAKRLRPRQPKAAAAKASDLSQAADPIAIRPVSSPIEAADRKSSPAPKPSQAATAPTEPRWRDFWSEQP